MPTSRKRAHRPSREHRAKVARAFGAAMAHLDVVAWIGQQKAATWRFCSVCHGRLRTEGEVIACRKCGRTMTRAEFDQQEAVRAFHEAKADSEQFKVGDVVTMAGLPPADQWAEGRKWRVASVDDAGLPTLEQA